MLRGLMGPMASTSSIDGESGQATSAVGPAYRPPDGMQRPDKFTPPSAVLRRRVWKEPSHAVTTRGGVRAAEMKCRHGKDALAP